jgi:hypothetical protein
LKNSIDNTRKNLELIYTPEEIEETFGDEDQDWIDAFTDGFLEDIADLEKKCLEIVKDCHERKGRLDHALIWHSLPISRHFFSRSAISSRNPSVKASIQS